MTDKQNEWTQHLFDKYLPLAVAVGTLISFVYGVGSKMESMQYDINNHTQQINQILQNQSNMQTILEDVRQTTTQNAQQLSDINRKVSAN